MRWAAHGAWLAGPFIIVAGAARFGFRASWLVSILSGVIATSFVWNGWTVLAMATGRYTKERRTRRERRKAGRCPACGYDLQGEMERGCPECGWKRQP